MDRLTALQRIADELQDGEPAFPTGVFTILRIREALEDPDCHAERAARLISADPLMSAKVVAAANSVAFNPAGREISDLKSAISRIGFTTTRSLVMSRIAAEIAQRPATELQRKAVSQLWAHSAYVASLARLLARKVTHLNPDTCFFTGLVHEMGSFYLISRAEDYPALLQADNAPGGPATVQGRHNGAADRQADGHPASGLADESQRLDGAEGAAPIASSYNAALLAQDEAVQTLEQDLSLRVMRALRLPSETLQAIEQYGQGYLSLPPSNLGDTLLLADYLAPVQSPLREFGYAATQAAVGCATVDMLVEADTLSNILEASQAEVDSLAQALQA